MLGKKELDARFDARDLDQEQSEAVETIRTAVRALATKLDKAVPDGRHKSLALTALEDVEMRAVKGISRGEEAYTPPAQAVSVSTSSSNSGPRSTAAGKLDLRTKEGRAAKAAREAGGDNSTVTSISDAAANRPRSRRVTQDA
jgi:hypothetical protein